MNNTADDPHTCNAAVLETLFLRVRSVMYREVKPQTPSTAVQYTYTSNNVPLLLHV